MAVQVPSPLFDASRHVLDVVSFHLHAYVKAVMEAEAPEKWAAIWQKEVEKPHTSPLVYLDIGPLLNLIEDHKRGIFKERFSDVHIHYLRDLRNHRNMWAHPSGSTFGKQDAIRLISSAEKILGLIDAPAEAQREVAAIKKQYYKAVTEELEDPRRKSPPWRVFAAAGVGVAFIAAAFVWARPAAPAFGREKIEIGTMDDLKKYEGFATHVKTQLAARTGKDDIGVVLNGGPRLSYAEAKDRIRNRHWDVVFGYSPMISLVAHEEGYRYAGRMFPSKPQFYKSCLFVRQDSPIQNLDDLKPNTVIALGQFISASSFYMPIYDLYGKTVSIRLGVRSETIKNMVKNGTADVGAAAFVALEKDLDTFRIIKKSRDIPGSGVYLSPNLSEADFRLVKAILDDAPADIKEKANYGPGHEPDYTEFAKVAQRTEEILRVVDLTRSINKPVTLSSASGKAAAPVR